MNTDVLIVGAGPTGLAAAVALRSRGVSVMVVDRQAAGANTSRAAVVNARTLEVLEGFDVARRLVKEGVEAPRFTIRDRGRTLIPVDFSGLPTDYPYSLMCRRRPPSACCSSGWRNWAAASCARRP